MTYDRKARKPSPNKLYRDPENGHVLGVCAGIADYFDVSSGTVRIGAIFGLLFFTLPTIVAYFAAGMLIEAKPDHLFRDGEQEAFWREMRTEPSRTASGLSHKFRDVEHRLRAAEAYVTSSEFKLNSDFNKL